MHRSSMLWIACLALMASACTATVRGRATTSEPPPPEPVVRDHRDHRRHREPPPPPPPEPEVRDHRGERPPPPPVVRDHRDRDRRGGWDSRGWVMLGEKWVSGKNDFIRVGARQGTFTRLMMVVEEGDLQLTRMIVEYENGRLHSPRVAHFFKEGDRTHAIDLQGDARGIRKIELRYANVGAGRRAKVSIWGRDR